MNIIKYILHKLKTKNKQKLAFHYDMVISLGEDCATAGHLSSTALRNSSMPFDWIDGAPFATRVQLIVNNFENWLKKDALEFFEIQTEVVEDHAFNRYKNVITNINFQHDFLVDVPFDDFYDNVKVKYERRIKRLQDTFDNCDRILLVWVARNAISSDQELIEAAKTLNDYSKRARLDIFYIQHDPNMDMDSFRFEIINEHITRFYLNNSSVDFSTHFQAFRGNIPQIVQIFWEFNLITYKALICHFSKKVYRKLGKIYRKLANKKPVKVDEND